MLDPMNWMVVRRGRSLRQAVVPCATPPKNRTSPAFKGGLCTWGRSMLVARFRGMGYLALWLPGTQMNPPLSSPKPGDSSRSAQATFVCSTSCRPLWTA